MAAAAIALRNKRQPQKLSPLKPLELPNGKGAWDTGADSRRSSRRRIGGKNKVGDSTLASQRVPTNRSANKQSGVVNILLYVGFLLMGLGLVLTFVGMGERGFKTKELQLIGPSLIGCGVLFTLLRILFCSFATISCKRKKPLDEKSLLSPSQETLATEPSVEPSANALSSIQLPRTVLPAVVRDSANLPPLKTHPHTSAVNTTPTETPHKLQKLPSLIEDEVESDTDLGLDVQYVEDDDGCKKGSRESTAKSVNHTTEEESSTLEEAHPSSTPVNEEVVLDPSRLVDVSNG